MQSTKPRYHRILFFSGVLSLSLVYVLSWIDVITAPTQRTASDFMAFYAAGRSMIEHGPSAAYELPYLKANEEEVLGFQVREQDVNPFVHPPFILPLLGLAARFDYVPAFYVWIFMMLGLCALGAYVAVGLIEAASGMDKLAVGLGVVLFFPLYISLLNGQDSAVLLLGALLWYYGLARSSHKLAGLGLALATIRPQIALVLAIPFFFNAAHRKVWWWFCAGSGILVLASFALLGWDGVQSFLRILSVSAGGEGYRINEAAMVNLIGLIKRSMPGLDAEVVRTIGWLSLLVGSIGLCIVWRKFSLDREMLLSLAVIVALFISPHLHYHDLSLLLIPILVLIRMSTRLDIELLKWAALLPFGISLVFILTYSIPPLTYFVVYLVQLALLVLPKFMGTAYGAQTK